MWNNPFILLYNTNNCRVSWEVSPCWVQHVWRIDTCYIFFIFMCGGHGILSTCMSAYYMSGLCLWRWAEGILWHCSHRWLSKPVMLVLGLEPGSCGRTSSVLNLWAISPAPVSNFFFSKAIWTWAFLYKSGFVFCCSCYCFVFYIIPLLIIDSYTFFFSCITNLGPWISGASDSGDVSYWATLEVSVFLETFLYHV